MKLLTLVCVVLLMGVSLARVGIVEACSGGAGTDNVSFKFVLDISVRDIYVAGRIQAVSDSGINAVLQVDYVIKGEVLSEYILLSRNTPSSLLENRGLGGCRTFGPRLNVGQRFVAGLGRGENGAYDGDLFKENEVGLFQVDNPDQQGEMLTLTYEQIIDYIAHRLNTVPHLTYNTNKPRAAALRLKTESGESYVLPADQTTLIKLSPSYECRIFTSDSSDCMRAPNGRDTVTFFPSGSNPEKNHYMDQFNSAVEGETGVFSSNSELITVWEGQELHVYATGRQWGISGASEYSTVDVTSYSFDAADPLLPGAGAWSSNGRTFAFSSQSGVWLWDALIPNSEPTLFLAAAGEPIIVRNFSPDGNYLALSASSRRYLIDLLSRQEYPDGLFSPDDRVLAAYDTTADELTPLTLYRVLPEMEPVWWNYAPTISHFEWIDSNTYLFAACGEPIKDPESGPGFDKPWCKVYLGFTTIYQAFTSAHHDRSWVDGVSFDYDPITHSLATLIDGDTITVNGDIIELEGQTDSPIIGIELIPLIDLDYRNF